MKKISGQAIEVVEHINKINLLTENCFKIIEKDEDIEALEVECKALEDAVNELKYKDVKF